MKKSAPILLLIILFGATAWYFFTKQSDEVHQLETSQLQPATRTVEIQTPVEVEMAEPEPESTDDIDTEPVILSEPLLPLNESDPQFTQSLTEVVGADPLAEYLVKGDVISRLVVTIDRLTSRQVPAQINPVKPVTAAFITEDEGESVVMSSQNFSRYDGYVALLQNIDSNTMMTLYQRYTPLFQQAWEENGGEGSFNVRLTEVIDNLLETPDVSGRVQLTKPEAVYLYEDPALEAMTAGQKILLRMGTANASIVKEKLSEIREYLSQ